MTMTATLDTHAPKAIAALRIMSGLLFLAHGTQKLLNFPVAEFQPPLLSLFGIGGIREVVTGVLIVLGLFTRPAAFVASGMMAVAYFMFHAPHSLYPAVNGGDAAVLFCFIFLTLVFTGPGAWALDNRTGRSAAYA